MEHREHPSQSNPRLQEPSPALVASPNDRDSDTAAGRDLQPGRDPHPDAIAPPPNRRLRPLRSSRHKFKQTARIGYRGGRYETLEKWPAPEPPSAPFDPVHYDVTRRAVADSRHSRHPHQHHVLPALGHHEEPARTLPPIQHSGLHLPPLQHNESSLAGPERPIPMEPPPIFRSLAKSEYDPVQRANICRSMFRAW